MSDLAKHPELEAYLNTVCRQVRSREVHEAIRQELMGHVTDRADALMATGLATDAALLAAIKQMGDPVAVGQELHRAHKPRMEWAVLLAVVALAAVGMLVMYSLSISGSSPVGSVVLTAQAVRVSLGLVAGGVLYFADYRKLQRHAVLLFALSFLSFVPAWRVYGANPVAEYALLPQFVALAALLPRLDWTARATTWKLAALLILPMLGYMASHHYALPVVYGAGFLSLLWATGVLRRWLIRGMALIGALVGLSGAVALSQHYVRDRLVHLWLHRGDPMFTGYVQLQIGRILPSVGLWGHGLGAGPNFMPELHADYVWVYLIYSLGWVGTAAFCLLVSFLLVRLLWMVRRVPDRFGRLLVTAVVTLLGLEFARYMLLVLGLPPFAGAALPFVGFGPQVTWQLAAVGLALGVYRRKDMLPAGPSQAA